MSSGGVNSSSSSSGRGNTTTNNNNNNNGVSSIPATSKKMVQSLKEIVNCSEQEIYAMLKECNMDPNDTVHRLLSQDTFREVKSKREKKKEVKETSESRPRAVSSTSNRGGRGGADRNIGRGVSAQFSSTESGAVRGKPAYRKENGMNAHPVSSSASGMPGNSVNRRPTYPSDSVNVESKTTSIVSGDAASSSSQPSPAYQPAWVGVPGQVSMADIVKMGRPKASSRPTLSTETSYSKHNVVAPNASYHSVKDPVLPAAAPSESNHEFHSLNDPYSKVSETIHEAGSDASQHVSHDEWPLAEQSAPSGLPVLEPSADHKVYGDRSMVSNLHTDRADLHPSSQSDEFRITKGDVNAENLNTESTGSAASSSRQIQDDSAGGACHFDNDSFNNLNSYQSHRHASDRQEVEDVAVAVSSAAANLQQLSLRKEELVVPPAEDNPAVKIPNHLQVPTADCLHLSFGSFGSGISATYSGPFAPKSHDSALEEVSVQPDVSSVGHSETRNAEYFGDEQFRSSADGSVDSRTAAGTIHYDSPSSSQPEVLKQDAAETTHGHNYSFAASVPGYGFENSAQPAFSYAHTNPQMQNLAPFSSVMQAYTNSLLASTVQAARESDVPFSPFLGTQSMPTKYSNSVSSISGPTISMPETLKPGVFSSPHPTQQALPGTSIATGPTLPQHLLQSYSQPTLPLGHFANMIGYPFMPQSYAAYMPPSAFQQAYGANNTYHQPPAAVHSGGAIKYTLPQFKNGAPVSSFPQTAAVASGHGGFGGSASIPGNFPLNASTTPSSSTTGYDDVISSHYKDNSHFLPLQQNDNSAMWVPGPGSRTVSAVPANTYYSFQGQGQQHSAFRQGQQQPSQHYGNLGYPNFYPSQTGVSQEHQQQQTQQDGTLTGSQGPPSKQSHQIWQHSY